MNNGAVLKTGKLISLLVMFLTASGTLIATMKGYLDTQTWGEIVIALGVFLMAIRGYLKDHYGAM